MSLKDALSKALAGNDQLELRDPPKTAAPAVDTGPTLPDPVDSEWWALLRRHVQVPRTATVGRLQQETAGLVKRWKKEPARKRELRSLTKARDEFLKQREGAAWKQIKLRWAALDLSEKGYRRLKQGKLQPEKVLTKLYTKAAEAQRGRAPAAVLAWLGET